MDYLVLAIKVVEDLDTVGLGDGFALYALTTRSWLYPGREITLETPKGFGDSGYVAVLLGEQRLIGEDAPPESDAVKVEMMSFAQDCVMDELGHGWPELLRDGKFAGLLVPLAAAGGPWWALLDEPVARVGSLGRLPVGSIRLEVPS